MRVASLEQNVFFAAHDKECGTPCEQVETFKIDIAAVHHVEGTRLGNDLVENIDVVRFPFCNADKRGNAAMQVQQGMHLDRRFVPAKSCPGKQRQAEIDGRGIQGIEVLIQLHAQGIVGIQGARDTDKNLSEVGIDSPVAQPSICYIRGLQKGKTQRRWIQCQVQGEEELPSS